MPDTTTIAAIATAPAAGGIGIVRVSGPDALTIADAVFESAGGHRLSASEGYRAYYGTVKDNTEKVDEAICLVFRAPRSYTGEDTAEISCHGGLYVTQRVLRAVLNAGAVTAAPGEFTKRAFLNGKMALADAEAVAQLIAAQGEQAALTALNALEGALSKKIHQCADRLLAPAAQLAAWVDYPDEDLEDVCAENLKEPFAGVKADLEELLRGFDAGRAVCDGIDTVIVGRPNVGKSTLMNLLTGFERSIVTEHAGTTRDVVEETVRLGDLILRLADTAGIRDTDHPVESIGVDLARKKLERAALVLAVFDGSDALTPEDKQLLESCRGKRTVAIINKTDLPRASDIDCIRAMADETVEISATGGEGLKDLETAVSRVLGAAEFDPTAARLITERQRACCVRALNALDEALAALESGVTLDAVTVCADTAIKALLELTGEKASEAVVNEVFRRFCVGK